MAKGDCLFAATGRDDRLAVVGRQVPQGCHRDRDRGDAFGYRHRALHQGRTPGSSRNSTSIEARHGRQNRHPAGWQATSARHGKPLWDGYLAFLQSIAGAGASDVAWARFHDADEPMFLLGAYVDGKLTGIVHYLFQPLDLDAGQLLSICRTCMSRKTLRGLGLGRALIEARV